MKEELLKKILILLIILFSLLILLLSACLIKFKYTDDLVLKPELTCSFREEVYPEDFIQFMKGQLLKNEKINTNEVGLKTVTIDYRNQYGYVTRKEFTLEVKDETAPIVIVSNPYVIEKGSNQVIKDNIFCADDYDDQVSCKLEGTYDLNTPGTYTLKMTATDKSGNQTEKKFTLKVVEPQTENNSSSHHSKIEYTKFSDILKKYKTKETMIGLDLSKWQGEVDFERLKQQGVEFVMLKIGGQRQINGEIQMDPQFLANIEHAMEEDLKVGVYFYSYADSTADAINQAKWVVQNLKDYQLDLPIAFDWENWSQFSTFHISFHTLNKIATSFFQEVEKNGYDTMLYASKYYLETIWYHEDYDNWIAYYTDQFDYENNYSMWQVCSDGKIEGIDSFVDINIFYPKTK